MKYTRLGNTGAEVSRLALGCMGFGDNTIGRTGQGWALGETEAREIIKKALDLGINYFDTANCYSAGTSEEFVGRALRDYANRHEIVIATKLFYPMHEGRNAGGLSRKEIIRQVDESLRRLGMDYIDLYLIHRWDYNTPIEETMDALNDVVKTGKVLYLGASSMHAWQFAKAQYTAEKHNWTKFSVMSVCYNLLYREEERDMLPMCADQHVGIVPWSPVAKGRLARRPGQKTQRSENESFARVMFPMDQDTDYEIVSRVQALSESHGVPMIQIALAWLLSKPAITAPIIGATKCSRLEEAVKGLDDVDLSEEEISYLEEPYRAHEIVGFE